MKLLTNGERVRVDSSQETIEKWDTLLKSGVKNLGFTDELIENMYPYEDAGLPLKSGEKLEYINGRVFWEMSWMDKLAIAFAHLKIESNRDHCDDIVYDFKVLRDFIIKHADKIFPGCEDAESIKTAAIAALLSAKIVKHNRGSNSNTMPSFIVTDDEKDLIIRTGLMGKKPLKEHGPIRDTMLSKLMGIANDMQYRMCIPIIPALNDIYGDFPLDDLTALIKKISLNKRPSVFKFRSVKRTVKI